MGLVKDYCKLFVDIIYSCSWNGLKPNEKQNKKKLIKTIHATNAKHEYQWLVFTKVNAKESNSIAMNKEDHSFCTAYQFKVAIRQYTQSTSFCCRLFFVFASFFFFCSIYARFILNNLMITNYSSAILMFQNLESRIKKNIYCAKKTCFLLNKINKYASVGRRRSSFHRFDLFFIRFI